MFRSFAAPVIRKYLRHLAFFVAHNTSPRRDGWPYTIAGDILGESGNIVNVTLHSSPTVIGEYPIIYLTASGSASAKALKG
jgi:hypothetical protein